MSPQNTGIRNATFHSHKLLSQKYRAVFSYQLLHELRPGSTCRDCFQGGGLAGLGGL